MKLTDSDLWAAIRSVDTLLKLTHEQAFGHKELIALQSKLNVEYDKRLNKQYC